ncbi:hypothetical protein ACSW8L_15945 (plasmid) [Clostridium perfringens]
MRDEIIVYCKDEEDIKETFKYIKELNVFIKTRLSFLIIPKIKREK